MADRRCRDMTAVDIFKATQQGQKNRYSASADRTACWRNLANTVEVSVLDGDVAFKVKLLKFDHLFNFWVPFPQRLLLGDRMPLAHGFSEKSFGSRILDTLPTLLPGRLPAALQFQVYIIKTRRFRFFGHVTRSDSRQDHHQAVSASLHCDLQCVS